MGSGVLLSGGRLPMSRLPGALTVVGLMQVRVSSVDQVGHAGVSLNSFDRKISVTLVK